MIEKFFLNTNYYSCNILFDCQNYFFVKFEQWNIVRFNPIQDKKKTFVVRDYEFKFLLRTTINFFAIQIMQYVIEHCW